MVIETREIRGRSKLYVARSADAPPTMKATPHRHSFYEVAWLEQGDGCFVCDFNHYDLKRGTLVFVAPGQVHTWQANETHNLILIGFKPSLFVHNWIDPTVLSVLPYFDLTARPFLTVPTHRQGLFDYLFSTIYQRYAELGVSVGNYIELSEVNEHILLAYLHLILIEAERLYVEVSGGTRGDSTSVSNQLTVAFQVKVEETFTQRWQISQYADALGVSPNYLAEVIRNTTGKSPSEWVQQRLVTEAQRLLTFTNETNAQIAEQLSFTSPSQFGQWFKGHVGISPGQFRRLSLKP